MSAHVFVPLIALSLLAVVALIVWVAVRLQRRAGK